MHLDIRASLKGISEEGGKTMDNLKEREQAKFDAVPWVNGKKEIIDDPGTDNCKHKIKQAFTGLASTYTMKCDYCELCKYTIKEYTQR